MVKWRFKNGHQDNIELRDHNLLTILSSTVNTIGGKYMIIWENENHHFDNDWDIHMSFKYSEEIGFGIDINLFINLN